MVGDGTREVWRVGGRRAVRRLPRRVVSDITPCNDITSAVIYARRYTAEPRRARAPSIRRERDGL